MSMRRMPVIVVIDVFCRASNIFVSLSPLCVFLAVFTSEQIFKAALKIRTVKLAAEKKAATHSTIELLSIKKKKRGKC